MQRLRTGLVVITCGVSWALAGDGLAGSATGRLALPPAPERPEPVAKGFVDRVENPLAPVRPVALTPYLIVVLEGEARPQSPGQVSWDLVGESFARPLIAAPVGAEVVIRNVSRTSRMLAAAEDPKLLPKEVINPTGPKSFRVKEPKIYTIGDADAPHLEGTLVVVNTPYIATVEPSGKFEFSGVAEGSYKVRVFYKDRWLALPDETVNVPSKGRAEITVKVPAAAFAPPAGKK
jgi:hypothetical protein